MTGEERRAKIINILQETDKPLNGTALSEELGVSRQVIVTDMALIRAEGTEITSTNRGYIINKPKSFSRVYKVQHTDEEAETEMNAIVDLGGTIDSVFIYHKLYGLVKAPMNIKNRRDVKRFLSDIDSGKSSFLKNAASGFHYHTVHADSEEILDDIMDELYNLGFLAQLTDYEPKEINS